MSMATLIKNKRIVPDSWQQLKPAAEGGLPDVPFTGDWIVPLAIWNEQRVQLNQRSGKNGVQFYDPAMNAEAQARLRQAREQGLDVRTGLADLSGSARGWLDGEGNQGLVKLVADAGAAACGAGPVQIKRVKPMMDSMVHGSPTLEW